MYAHTHMHVRAHAHMHTHTNPHTHTHTQTQSTALYQLSGRPVLQWQGRYPRLPDGRQKMFFHPDLMFPAIAFTICATQRTTISRIVIVLRFLSASYLFCSMFCWQSLSRPTTALMVSLSLALVATPYRNSQIKIKITIELVPLHWN